MFYANKKTTVTANKAQQTAKILANVKSLLEKKLIEITTETVFLYPQLWKDEASALNWMKCLQIYCVLRKQFKEKDTIHFVNIETKEPIGIITNSNPKLLNLKF